MYLGPDLRSKVVVFVLLSCHSLKVIPMLIPFEEETKKCHREGWKEFNP